MTKNPLLNAVAAAGYIILVVSLLASVQDRFNGPDTIMAPIAMLSLLTLSVATMAYLFFYQPTLLFLENHKKEAVELFVRTLGMFAGITVLVFLVLFSGVVQIRMN